ncbi:DNA polymerase I, partial [Flavobacteriales bacterium]|nr:DNA polymerase I [Flavobacteriales bacterium]
MAQVKKLFLIDAFALIYRSYFAFSKNPRINSKGLETSAILGFVNSLVEVIKKEKPTHIAVVFDTPAATVRHEEYSEYKANREAMPEGIAVALPYIDQLLEAFNISKLYADGYEADDVIGTLAKKAEKQGFVTYMMTPDKDFAQLVSENILLYRPGNKWKPTETWGVKEVLEKFEIKNISQVIDFLGMMGDAVDNIPGLPGVGEKTAKKLLAEYGNMEGLLENAHLVKGKLGEKIQAHKEQGILSKRLATILLDAPVEINESALAIKKFDAEKVQALFEELEFRNLAKRLLSQSDMLEKEEKSESNANQIRSFNDGQMDLFTIGVDDTPPAPSYQTIEDLKTNYTLVEKSELRAALLEKLLEQHSVCFDTETNGLNPLKADIIGMSFSYQKNEAYYVHIPEGQEKAIVNEFKSFFEHPEIQKIAQNLKYDYKVLAKYGIYIKGPVFDTMLAHYLLEPDKRHNMEVLAQNYLNYSPISIETLIGKKGKNQLSMRQAPLEQLCPYACEDADITFQLKEIFHRKLKGSKTFEVFKKIEMPLIPVLSAMEMEGIKIDIDALADFSKELEQRVVELNDNVQQLAGTPFNLASPKQLGQILFEHMKLVDKPKKTKTGQYSTSEDTLLKLKGKHAIIDDILEFRQLQKLKSTYVDALPELADADTHRIHTTYQQAVAATGRLSSVNPNLQNIPIRSEKGREVRKAFVPKNEDFTLLAADYSQIELRLMAHLSQDEGMLSAFQNGEDIHAATAAKVYQVELEKVSREQRSYAKMVNFGIIYGISAFGLAQRLGIKRGEAKEIIDNYFLQYPKVKDYMELSIENAREKGFVETIMGRKRMLNDINSRNAVVRGYAERNAINAPIQGSAADIIKMAMINVDETIKEQGFKSKLLLQVHDELVFDVHKSEVKILKNIIKDNMENALLLSVPLK